MLFFFSLNARRSSSLARFLLFSCSIACLLLVVACTGMPPEPAAKRITTPTATPKITVPGDLITPGVLTVGSYTGYLPQEYINPATHQATGFDIELIQAIAQRMNLRTKIVTDDYSILISNLMSGRYDVVISAISITDELKAKVDFIPYFKGGESLLVAKGNPQNISNLADLCGLSVGVKDGSFEQDDLRVASDACKKSGKPVITTITSQKFSDVVKLLSSRRVVATYQDAPLTDYFVKQDPDSFEVAGSVINPNLEGIAVRKGDTSMHTALDGALNALKVDGTYRFIIERWGLVSGDITVADHKTSFSLLPERLRKIEMC